MLGGRADADHPRGTYALDRHSKGTAKTSYPECGSTEPDGGQATFAIDYAERILVNGREWRLSKPATTRDDKWLVIDEPNTKTEIWFGTSTPTTAVGVLQVWGARNGRLCVDAWLLSGTYKPH